VRFWEKIQLYQTQEKANESFFIDLTDTTMATIGACLTSFVVLLINYVLEKNFTMLIAMIKNLDKFVDLLTIKSDIGNTISSIVGSILYPDLTLVRNIKRSLFILFLFFSTLSKRILFKSTKF